MNLSGCHVLSLCVSLTICVGYEKWFEMVAEDS